MSEGTLVCSAGRRSYPQHLVAVEAVLYAVLHVVDIKVEKNRSQDGAMW